MLLIRLLLIQHNALRMFGKLCLQICCRAGKGIMCHGHTSAGKVPLQSDSLNPSCRTHHVCGDRRPVVIAVHHRTAAHHHRCCNECAKVAASRLLQKYAVLIDVTEGCRLSRTFLNIPASKYYTCRHEHGNISFDEFTHEYLLIYLSAFVNEIISKLVNNSRDKRIVPAVILSYLSMVYKLSEGSASSSFCGVMNLRMTSTIPSSSLEAVT